MMPRRRGQVRRVPTSVYDVATELALIGFTLAVAYSFRRLFVDSSFFVPVAAAAITAHVAVAGVRWARGGLLVSAAVSTLVFGVVTWLLFPPTTLEPGVTLSRDAIASYGTDFQLAWEQFKTVSSPAEVSAPFLLLLAIMVWVIAFLSDWATFRLRSPGEALIPGIAVFVFGSFFADGSRVTTTVLLLGTALALVLFHRLSEASTAGAWLGNQAAERGQASLLRVGMGIVAITIIGGVGVAQALPGYNEPPLENFDPTTWDDPEDPRVVLSPLVDIQSRLIDQPDVEVFTVSSPVRDYWRITSLDVFDGSTWRSRGSFGEAAGPLDSDLPDGTVFDPVVQTFDIKALGRIWLPAAYEPSEIVSAPEEIDLEYERESGTLIVSRDQTNSDGLQYALRSWIPQRDREAIAAAGDGVPDEIAERYLDLPDNFSDRIRQEAADIVAAADAQTPYEKALALQNYFRDPSLFSYSLDVSEGHASENIEDFLFEVHAGYCEQFSGSYAAMARSLGLPARVAVGFTPGEWDPEIEAYRVTGKHAHAWPEVYIEDIGWLRFEPTPGRGAPGDEAYTDQPEAQEGSTPTDPSTTTTTIAPADGGAAGESTVPPAERPGQETPSPTTTLPPQDESGPGIVGGADGPGSGTIFRGLAIASAVVFALAFPMAFGALRSRRRYQSVIHDPRKRIGLAWAESRSALQLMGLTVSDSDTPKELVQRVGEHEPDAATALRPLAMAVTSVTYGGGTVDVARAIEAEAVPKELAGQAREKLGRFDWVVRHANPVNVWRDRVGTWRHLR